MNFEGAPKNGPLIGLPFLTSLAGLPEPERSIPLYRSKTAQSPGFLGLLIGKGPTYRLQRKGCKSAILAMKLRVG